MLSELWHIISPVKIILQIPKILCNYLTYLLLINFWRQKLTFSSKRLRRTKIHFSETISPKTWQNEIHYCNITCRDCHRPLFAVSEAPGPGERPILAVFSITSRVIVAFRDQYEFTNWRKIPTSFSRFFIIIFVLVYFVIIIFICTAKTLQITLTHEF